jgi:hypothetical protein
MMTNANFKETTIACLQVCNANKKNKLYMLFILESHFDVEKALALFYW